ncbi:hypothetical protein MMC14_001991 [Varicellaria rhodocarpa]|nr:hypothetical protein [Varicellaria rhodocarpa]
MSPTRHPVFTILLAVIYLAVQAFAQSSSTPSTASSAVASAGTAAPTIIQTFAQSTYQGCYNETTGDAGAGNVRALAGGNMVGYISCFTNPQATLL